MFCITRYTDDLVSIDSSDSLSVELHLIRIVNATKNGYKQTLLLQLSIISGYVNELTSLLILQASISHRVEPVLRTFAVFSLVTSNSRRTVACIVYVHQPLLGLQLW